MEDSSVMCPGFTASSGKWDVWQRGVSKWRNGMTEGGLVHGLGLHFD